MWSHKYKKNNKYNKNNKNLILINAPYKKSKIKILLFLNLLWIVMVHTAQTDLYRFMKEIYINFLFGIDFWSIRAYNHVRRQKQSAGVKVSLERAKWLLYNKSTIQVLNLYFPKQVWCLYHYNLLKVLRHFPSIKLDKVSTIVRKAWRVESTNSTPVSFLF